MKNVKKNKYSMKLVIGILVIIFIFLIGIYFFFNFQERSGFSPVDYSNYPKKGESFRAVLESVIEKGGYREDIDNVEVMMTDITTGISQTNTTQSNPLATIDVIVGKTYNFVANFNGSTKSATCTIGLTDKGWICGVYILVSENNTIDSIECEKLEFQ